LNASISIVKIELFVKSSSACKYCPLPCCMLTIVKIFYLISMITRSIPSSVEVVILSI